jgi:hypothetical protein
MALIGAGQECGLRLYALIDRRVGEDRARPRLGRALAQLIPPIIGGLLVGLMAYAFPMTLGDGAVQLTALIVDSAEEQLERSHLAGFVPDIDVAACVKDCLSFGGQATIDCVVDQCEHAAPPVLATQHFSPGY